MNLKSIKPKKGYAVVKKANPRINLLDVYDSKDIRCEKNEVLIEVEIKAKRVVK